MKTINNNMFRLCMALLLCFSFNISQAQDAEAPAPPPIPRPVKNTFENGVQINNQTVETTSRNGLEMMIQHRFGEIKNNTDLYGIFAPANIRFGLSYGVIKNLSVGVGVTKARMQYDFEWKYN